MSEMLLGISPMLKSIAFQYLQKGIGSHAVAPPLDVFYDEVIVAELYPWKGDQGGMVVEFYLHERRVRWVEFGARVIGGGGDPVLRKV